jgi:tetratricopeptide (TPR) repeat protein
MYASASAMIKADDTVAAAQEALEIFREINHSGGMVMTYANLARWESIHGNFQEAEKYVALMTSIRENGTVSNQSGFLNMGIGMGARAQGRFDLARRYFEESLRVFKQTGHKGMTAILTSEIAHTQRAMGNYTEAKKTYQETIKVFQEYGNRPAVAHQLECFAMIAIVEEEPQRAAQLFAAAEALREATGHKRTDEEEVEHVQFMSRLHLMLSETEFNEFWVKSKSIPMEQAVSLATS